MFLAMVCACSRTGSEFVQMRRPSFEGYGAPGSIPGAFLPVARYAIWVTFLTLYLVYPQRVSPAPSRSPTLPHHGWSQVATGGSPLYCSEPALVLAMGSVETLALSVVKARDSSRKWKLYSHFNHL